MFFFDNFLNLVVSIYSDYYLLVHAKERLGRIGERQDIQIWLSPFGFNVVSLTVLIFKIIYNWIQTGLDPKNQKQPARMMSVTHPLPQV